MAGMERLWSQLAPRREAGDSVMLTVDGGGGGGGVGLGFIQVRSIDVQNVGTSPSTTM